MGEKYLEVMKNTEKFQGELSKEDVLKAIEYVLSKIDENLEVFTYKLPASSSVNNVYEAIDNVDWTSSFWTGMVLLAYEITNDKKYLEVANKHLDSFKNRIIKKVNTNHHDLGFLYTLSSVANYKITGNEEAKEVALLAAKELMNRYFDKAGIIQAWGELSDPDNRGRIIIDCLMNLPLLYWASEVTGDKTYYDAAYNHAKQASKYIIREDASTFHTYYMDVETGEPLYGKTAQGYSDDSCWSRGQAWGMYGFPLSYKYTKDYSLIEDTKKVSNYFLNRLPEDNISYWDLIFVDGEEPRDSSAASIAACGLLELVKYLPDSDADKMVYNNAAKSIIKSLILNYTTSDISSSNGILKHGVYSIPHKNGVDECCIWGDYYYFEALVRLYKDWNLYW